MRIQESRKLFDAYQSVSFGERTFRLEKIIKRAEHERAVFESSEDYDKMVILPIEIIVAELIKNLYGLSDVRSVVSYDPIYAELSKYDLSLTKACNAAGVTPAARTAIGLGLPIHLEYLMKLATLLGCEANKLFYEIDINEHRRRTIKKAHIENLSKQYAQLIDGLIDAPSEAYIESLSKTDTTYGRDGISFGPGGLTLEQVEQMLEMDKED